MMPVPPRDTAGATPREAETARLRAVYAARDASGLHAASPGTRFMREDRDRRIAALLAARLRGSLAAADVLEIGCGTGHNLRHLAHLGATPARLAGVDLMPDRIARARAECPPEFRLECQDATRLSEPDASRDLVLLFTVMSSVLDPAVRAAIAGEVTRVLRPGGAVLWYDFHVGNPRNPDVRGIAAGEIARLFPALRRELHRVTLAPPLARWLAPRAPRLAQLLAAIPLLRTHYLGWLAKPRGPE